MGFGSGFGFRRYGGRSGRPAREPQSHGSSKPRGSRAASRLSTALSVTPLLELAVVPDVLELPSRQTSFCVYIKYLSNCNNISSG
jgi:hypothetical protein